MHTASRIVTVASRNGQHALPISRALMYCTMLSMFALPSFAVAATAYPGSASAINGTVLNSGAASPANSAANSNGVATAEAMPKSVNNSPAQLIAAKDLGEPDSSPALFAARTEIEAEPAIDTISTDGQALPATSTADASGAIHPILGEPDDSPALFAARKELPPVQNADKVTGVLTSFMKPVSEEEKAQAAANAAEEGIPVAAYRSPGVVIKKEQLAQTQYQTGVEKNELQMASLVPASGETANDSGPLIQLPEVDQPKPAQPQPAPVAAAPVVKASPAPAAAHMNVTPVTEVQKPAAEAKADTTEPRRELSPASKAVLNQIPSNLGKPVAKAKEPVSIDRAKEPDSSAVASVKHEQMGIKIEVKEPKLDMSYELEKAYNAVIAGQTATAMDIYKNILANDPNNKGALFGLGTLYHRAGQIDTARKLYSKLLSIEPSNRDALNNFLVLMADEAPEAALEQLSRLEKRDPRFSPIPAQMAIIYEKMGDMDKASEKMFRAIDLAPENMVYRYNLAIMLDKQQKYDEAEKLYHQIVEAYQRGESIPGNIQQIQQRLTYISSNR